MRTIDYITIFVNYNQAGTSSILFRPNTHEHSYVQYDKHLLPCFHHLETEWCSQIYHPHQTEHIRVGHRSKCRTQQSSYKPESILPSLDYQQHIQQYLQDRTEFSKVILECDLIIVYNIIFIQNYIFFQLASHVLILAICLN